MSKMQEDINEIKTDVKALSSIVQEALIRQAVLESQLNTLSGKVNGIVALALAAISGLAYAAWDFIKSRFL